MIETVVHAGWWRLIMRVATHLVWVFVSYFQPYLGMIVYSTSIWDGTTTATTNRDMNRCALKVESVQFILMHVHVHIVFKHDCNVKMWQTGIDLYACKFSTHSAARVCNVCLQTIWPACQVPHTLHEAASGARRRESSTKLVETSS